MSLSSPELQETGFTLHTGVFFGDSSPSILAAKARLVQKIIDDGEVARRDCMKYLEQ